MHDTQVRSSFAFPPFQIIDIGIPPCEIAGSGVEADLDRIIAVDIMTTPPSRFPPIIDAFSYVAVMVDL